MKIKIIRVHNGEGLFVDVSLLDDNGSLIDKGYQSAGLYPMSRSITGHTSESGTDGIFSAGDAVTIRYGARSRVFQWDDIDWLNDPLTEIATRLRQRIAEVRAFVAEAEKEETLEFEI